MVGPRALLPILCILRQWVEQVVSLTHHRIQQYLSHSSLRRQASTSVLCSGFDKQLVDPRVPCQLEDERRPTRRTSSARQVRQGCLMGCSLTPTRSHRRLPIPSTAPGTVDGFQVVRIPSHFTPYFTRPALSQNNGAGDVIERLPRESHQRRQRPRDLSGTGNVAANLCGLYSASSYLTRR